MAQEHEARALAQRLGQAVVEPAYRPISQSIGAIAGGAVTGALWVLATGSTPGGLALGLVFLIVVGAFAWGPVANPRYQAAVELIYDHNCHEAAEWKALTHTSMPRTHGQMERWIRENPTSPGRAAILLLLGRLDEAGQAIDGLASTTAEEAFGVEILRQTRVLYGGGTPELADLKADWRTISDSRERRHRRQCLAILEAMTAARDGRDPLTPLALARGEIPEVHWSSRVGAQIAKFALIGVVAIVTAAVITGAVLGAG